MSGSEQAQALLAGATPGTEKVLRMLAEYLKHSHRWEAAVGIEDEGDSEGLMAEADGELSKLNEDHVLMLAEQNRPQGGGYYTQEQAQMYLEELGAVCEMLGLDIDESHEISPTIATLLSENAALAAEVARLQAQAGAGAGEREAEGWEARAERCEVQAIRARERHRDAWATLLETKALQLRECATQLRTALAQASAEGESAGAEGVG